jgi:hypothetical protein
MHVPRGLKQKSRLAPRLFSKGTSSNRLCSGLGHRADAARTKRLPDPAIALENGHFLQIRLELTIGGAHRERPIVAEGCCFSTVGTFSHLKNPFLL